MYPRRTAALDPIRSLGAQLWLLEVAPGRWHIDGWLPDWRFEREDPSTSVGFAFELDGIDVRQFHLLTHGRVRPFAHVTSIEEAVRKLQVAVKIAQGRIVLVESAPPSV
jgi:hypothetical protein